jgi:hypothetical protein
MADSETVVELRVHGVSGAPPEALLGCDAEFVERTAGDAEAGFYRRRTDEIASPTVPSQWRTVMEAYSWGALTSGRASRALWLLFLPFILIDLAHWMLPPAGRRRPAAISVALLRLIALSFTLTLMLASAIAVMDVIVWQCAGLDHCGAGPVRFLASWPRGRQLAVSAVPLLVAIGMLWWLGSEETKVDMAGRVPPPSPAVLEDEPPPLAQESFWNPDESVLRLRYCHVMAWTAGLAAVVLAAPVRYAAAPSVHAVSVGLLAANGLILAIAVLATVWGKATARGGKGVNRLTTPLNVVRGISLGLLAASLFWVGVADVSYPAAPTPLPGLHGAIYLLFVVQVMMLSALFVFTALSMRGTRTAERTRRDGGYRMTLGGFTGPFIALVGWLIGGGFSVGVGLGSAQTFGKAVLSTDAAVASGDAPLIVPPPYVWAAVATVATITVAIAVGAYVWLRVIPKRTDSQLSAVQADYPGVEGVTEQLIKIAKARAMASLTDVGARSLAAMAVVAVTAAFAMLVVNLSVPRFDSFNWSGWIFRFSVVISVALVSGLVFLVVAAYRNRQLRRAVAILWDVVTFWPRANHPLTPPSYGARTVWDVRLRLDGLRRAHIPVVLVAHSQGTVIAAATLLQAHTGPEHYPLLTFGSPLRRLYAQNFPAYFGTDTLQRLRRWQLEPKEQWINLWCHTDPIGAWIFDDKNTDLRLAQSGDIDCRLFDVQRTGSVPEPGGPICGHSGFWTRDEYEDAMKALQSTVMPEGSAPPDTSATAPPAKELL